MKPFIAQLAECEEFGYKFEVDAQFWEKVEELCAVLQPLYDLTINMQKVGFGLADFYIGWLRVKKKLQRILKSQPQFDLAANLISCMDRRAPSLFDSPLFLCAVYLDPRMMMCLSDEQRAAAAFDLTNIQERIRNSGSYESKSPNNTLDEIVQDFRPQNNTNHSQNLIQEMSIYELEAPADINQPVMTFWEVNAHKFKLLKPIADVIHTIPANQCCTESSFSSLSYIRSKLRMSMAPKNVSNVLMVRLNKDVYYKLRQERMDKILAR